MAAKSKKEPKGEAEDLLQAIARHLLWAHLVHGRAVACAILTNSNRSIDGIHLQVLIPQKTKFSSWSVFLADLASGVSDALDSRMYYPELLYWPTEIDWKEFTFGRVWPDPMEPDDDYQFEELLDQCSPGEWPGLIVGAGYLHWAVVDMAKQGRIDDRDFVMFLREQEGLDRIGEAEICAVGEVAEDDWVFPFNADSVIELLAGLRASRSGVRGSRDGRDDATLSRLLIEPWLMITPGVPEDLLTFIASDPSCPAMILANENPLLPTSILKIANEMAGASTPKGWELKHKVVGSRPSLEGDSKKLPKGHLLLPGDTDAAQARDQLADSMSRILQIVPNPSEEDDEDSLEGLVVRHLQFLQASVWLRGGVALPSGMVKKLNSHVRSLLKALEKGDIDDIAEVAYESWTAFRR